MPDFPDGLAYLWRWYLELAPTRAEGWSGAGAVTYTEIDAWAYRMDRDPLPHEVDALRRLDDAIRVATRPPKEGTDKKRGRSHP